MSTSSMSKGCFVFKPKKKQKGEAKEEDGPTLEHFLCEDCESAESCTSSCRFRLCQQLWDHIRSHTEVLQEGLNRKVLDSLLDFVCTSGSPAQHNHWAWQMRTCEIPTAALVLGVNVPDHDVTFQSLSEMLQQSATPHVVTLQAKECGVLKALIKRVLERVMKAEVFDIQDDVVEHSETSLYRSVHCSLSQLCDWYASKSKICSSTPGKKCRSLHRDNSPHLPIVIIFRDLEAFNPKVLQEFIVICSRYVERLPLVFIFGIATSPSTIQHMLPHSVSSLLCIQLFQSLCCTQHLSTVIDQLILTHQFPFKLTAKVMQVLISIFLFHDFSVCNFIKGFQIALLEHFYSQPLSVLCCRKPEALIHLRDLGPTYMKWIRELPSFQRFLEKQDREDQVKLMTNDTVLKEVCHKLIKDLHKYHKSYYPTLRCLHTLTSSLPQYPLGKQIRELHLICLEKKVWESEDYQFAMKLLKMQAKDELLTLLQKCVEILHSAKSKKMKTAAAQLEELLSRFQQLQGATVIQDCFSPIGDLQKKTDLFQLQKTLLQLNETRRFRMSSPFENLRNDAVDLVDSLVKMHLVPPESLPLHEVYYFSSSATVRRLMNASPRNSIQAALRSSHVYLQVGQHTQGKDFVRVITDESLEIEDGTVPIATPDLCIAYKLHLECGRLINLYDWMQAFSTVVCAIEQLDSQFDSLGRMDEIKHARFICSVSELEFLGFIKSTKKKTDHVSRLTWSGC